MTGRGPLQATVVCLLVLLGITSFAVRNAPASTSTWAISLDADSTGPADAYVQNSHSIVSLTGFAIGAVLNASSVQPVNNVRGWQFGIVYENASLAPGQVQFGAQTGSGNPDWALMVGGGNGIGSHRITHVNATACGCDPTTHAEIMVYFAVLGNTPPVNIGPVLSPTVQGNLLAAVSFNITKPLTVSEVFTSTDIIFVDGNFNSIPRISAGSSATETIRVPTPPPSPSPTSDSSLITLGIAAGIIVAVAALTVFWRRRGKASTRNSMKNRGR